MTLLVLAAHPDDETLGAGGTIAAARARGDRVHVAVFCSPERADLPAATGAAAKAGELRAAMAELDCTYECYGFADQGLDAVPLFDLARAIEKTARALTPDHVITHFGGDVNQDHRRVAEATQVAFRPLPQSPVRRLEACYVPSSTEWGARPFFPTVFRPLDAARVEKKLAAMRRYTSELRAAPHPRSEHGIRAALAYFGSCAGVEFAEPFVLLREVGGP
jgi:LmbE family N-acetylglucosaminyl deacetylase